MSIFKTLIGYFRVLTAYNILVYARDMVPNRAFVLGVEQEEVPNIGGGYKMRGHCLFFLIDTFCMCFF